MNMHVPQSITTANELLELAAVPNQIISVRECKPIISIVQDVALGVYRITKSGVKLNQKQFFNLMANNIKFTGMIPKADDDGKWSGRQIMSTIIPKNINVKAPNKSWEGDKPGGDKENYVVIENGELTQGILDKMIYQNRTKGLVHSIFNECGPQETRIFFDNTQKIICDWLLLSGFSVGISDLIVKKSTVDDIKKRIHDMKVSVYDQIKNIHSGHFENKSISNNKEFFETEVNKILNQTVNQVGKMVLSNINDLENRMINMVKSGSKGSIINVSQMIACLGQQNVDGKRIPYGFDDRTLPHYAKFDDGPESRGFVENSFIAGLSPQEFFFHAMGGREGLIDTAVKSVTGDTEILIIDNNKPKCVKIGEWIDENIEKNKKDIKYFPEDRNMELLDLKQKVYIPTGDKDGNITWGELTAVTRHDPGSKVYAITTLSGRKVTVADSETLLVWNDKEFIKTHSSAVKVGSYIPVTVKLPEPPIILDHIDMSEFFSKKEYIYGTDYNMAINELEKIEKNRVPAGWWNKNNNKVFTLPYQKVAMFKRTLMRSNPENIQNGYIYPYKGPRTDAEIPDKFELNYENGIFLGLYLSEGHSCESSGKVGITNNDEKIQEFVINWYKNLNISYNVEKKTTTLTNTESIGTSTTVNGNSTILARFMNKIAGHKAGDKYVPEIAFCAPESFIKGILNGYFSGDGHICKHGGIEASSASSKLIEGISLLCSRLGIFGKISCKKMKENNLKTKNILPINVIAIRGHWASKLSESIDLLLECKNEKLKAIPKKKSHINFKEYNDVVLDKIINIDIIEDTSNYTKLYDVTVPSTLNFNCKNGIVLNDTSEIGYLQRKLVKGMEDCKINYDYTVRNASGSIIQFLYGEDGMDATKIESQLIPYIEMDYSELRKNYLFTEMDDFKYILLNHEKVKPDYDRLKQHFDQLLKDREFMICDIFEYKKETSIMYPVSFMRMINNYKALYNKYDKGVLLDITPDYILDTIDGLCKELYINKNNRGDKFMQVLIRCYLSPKKVIFDYRFGKTAFDNLVQQVKLKFYEAIAHPSEMVGVIAAQSIGEPATQMSAIRETIVRVTGENNFTYSGTIAGFIDKLLDNNKKKVITIGQDSVVLDLDETYNIIGVSNDEKTSWKRISQVSRHPANGNLVTVKTRSGKTTTATLTHSFLKRTEKGIDSIKGSELKIGDRIPVARKIGEVQNPQTVYEINGEYYPLDKDFGWLCGVYIADGNINGNNVTITKCIPEYNEKLKNIVFKYIGCDIKQLFREGGYFEKYDKRYPSVGNVFTHKEIAQFLGDEFGRGSENKYIPAWVYGCNKEFISGIIQGYFDGDGNVATGKGKGMIRTGSISEKLICDMIVLLAYFGLFASKCLEWSKMGKEKKKFYTIQISRKYAQLYKDTIGFTVKTKADGLDKVIDYVNRPDKAGHDQEYIDKIPCITNLLLKIKDELKCKISINTDTDSMGRVTAEKKLKYFEEINAIKKSKKAEEYIESLRDAVYSDVVWDEIIELEYLDDPKEYVYDFTVPGNDSFMVDTCILVHNTLNTFHLSGVSSASKAVRGVPRIKELLSVTKNIKSPSMTVYLAPEIKRDKFKSTQVLNSVETTYFKDIVTSVKIFYDPNDFDTKIDDDKDFLSTYKDFYKNIPDLSPWLLRMELNKEKLNQYNITMIDIFHVLNDFYNKSVNLMFSDDNSNKLIFRIKLIDPSDNKSLDEKDMITSLKALEKNIMESLIIKGIKKITKVSMNKKESDEYNTETMKFEKAHEWVLETFGSNLIDIMCHKNVDNTKTVSNNINEIYELLGIEAARQALYNEIWEVIRDGDLYLNYRHLALLVDTMTNKGYLLSIDRHGINRVDIGPLAKSSFEETTDMLIKAGIFSEVDKINGVSANIMLGQIPPCGTGDTDILIDESKLSELLCTLETVEEEEPVDEETIENICSLDNLTFDFTLPAVDKTIKEKNIKVTIKK